MRAGVVALGRAIVVNRDVGDGILIFVRRVKVFEICLPFGARRCGLVGSAALFERIFSAVWAETIGVIIIFPDVDDMDVEIILERMRERAEHVVAIIDCIAGLDGFVVVDSYVWN